MAVLVTGATGKAGRHVVDQLLARGARVRALTREPASARLPASVEVVRGDLTAPDTLAPALEGVDGVHLITTDADYAALRTGPQLAELLDRAGVRRLTVLWNGAPGPVEDAIDARGLPWTLLEANDFMGNALTWAGAVAEGVVREPFADVPVAAVHEADVGAVAAEVLTSDGHAGLVYRLSGPQPLTVRDRVATLAEVLGRPLLLEELSEAQARARWREAGLAEEMVDTLVAWQSDPPPAARRATDAVQRVTGRPPRTFAQWATEHAAAFGAVAAGA